MIQPAARARQPHQFLFICGLHRSGTTALEHWLHSRFDLSVLRAPVPESEGQHLQDVLPGDFHHGGPGQFGHAAAMRPAVPARWQRPFLRRRILQCWTPWIQGESPILLEKSPPNIVRIRWLRAVFPGAGFILLTRHPLATSLATRKWQRKPVAALMRHWRVSHRKALEDWQPDCLHLRYEDFCANPDTALERCQRAFRLTRREVPLPVSERFASLEDSNGRYLGLARQGPLGPGIWEKLGYSADSVA